MAHNFEKKELRSEWRCEDHVKTYGEDDLSKHKSKNDCWIVIHGRVYDVTNYLGDHPGGNDVLLELAGSDATTAYEDIGHSEDASEIMKGLLVGTLNHTTQKQSVGEHSNDLNASQIVHKRTTLQDDSRQVRLNRIRPGIAVAVTCVAGLGWSLKSFVATQSDQVNGGKFLQGFLAAGATFIVVGSIGIGYMGKVAKFGDSFDSYPAHFQTTTHTRDFCPAGCISPQEYRKFKLRTKEEVSEGIWRFTFDLPTEHAVLGLPIGQHVAIKGVVEGLTVVRSYTPISLNRDLGRLELLIRVYPDGKLGNLLRGLNSGDEAEITGPKGAMRYRKGMSKSIGMVGGGTGITPLFQIIRAICEDETDDTRIDLIYGNRAEADIMLRDRLDHFAAVARHKFRVHYTLDRPTTGWIGGTGHVTKQLLADHMPPPAGSSKIMLCGPPGMVDATKNNLIELGFDAPGAVSKSSDQIFCF